MIAKHKNNITIKCVFLRQYVISRALCYIKKLPPHKQGKSVFAAFPATLITHIKVGAQIVFHNKYIDREQTVSLLDTAF